MFLAVISSDFNPSLYLGLSKVFLQRYTDAASPVAVLETYLELLIQGHCSLDDKRVLDVKSFDVARYSLSEAKVKGQHYYQQSIEDDTTSVAI